VSSEWDLLWRLAVALALSSAIGLEREMRQKSAGLRTYSLVGLGAALFVLVSTYGFSDVLDQNHVVLDPSRVAAQIVSGIGFIGGGLIFVRRDSVRGLTTAAGIWVTAAVGTAAGAGLAVLATATTAAYFLIAYGYPGLADRLPRSRWAAQSLRLTYLDGHASCATRSPCARRPGSRWPTWPCITWATATTPTRRRSRSSSSCVARAR
jgi:putative Mg2+ transporter-C (MgtC) family protein